MEEVWKPVTGYEGLYKVSNLGNVKSLHGLPKLIRGWKNKQGYIYVKLSKYGVEKTLRVHRLVADAFCARPDGCDVVNHIDNDHGNNCSSNLEWVTQKENLYHAARIGVRTIRPVVRSDGNHDVRYPSMRAVEKDGFANSSVKNCCEGKQKSHRGFMWRYAEDA